MKKGIILLLAALFVLSCTSVEQDGGFVERNGSEHREALFVPGSAEVRFSPEMTEMIEETLVSGSLVTKSAGLNEVFVSLGVTSLERIFPYAGEYEDRTRREGLHRWYRVKFDEDIPLTKSAAAFGSLDGVEVFEPERTVKVNGYFNDPMSFQQWNLLSINLVPVWKEYTAGDPSVIVGVVDVGFDIGHKDLSGNYRGGYNFYNHNTDIIAGDHGTHVAGIISAVSNNGTGVSGIAGGDYAKRQAGTGLLSCQIFVDGKNGSGSGAEAIKWAADNGALIAQNSWGYNYNTEEEAESGTMAGSLKAAIDYFIEYAGCDNYGEQLPDSPMKGGLVVFSAGNDAFRYNPIGQYDPVISVGAVASDLERAYYSNYGDWVDICAPGGDREKGIQVMSTLPGSKYGYMQGTSMACPHVSGVAALVISYCGGPGYTCDDLKAQLIGGANPDAVDPGLQVGPLLDALGAITYGSTSAPSKVSSYEAVSVYDSVDLSWEVTTDARGVRAYGYKVFAAPESSMLEGIDYDAPLAGIIAETIYVGDLEAGETIGVNISGFDLDSPCYVMIVGFSYNGVYSQPSEIRKVYENRPPAVIGSIDSFIINGPGEKMVFDLDDYLRDPDGEDLTYVVSSSDGSIATGEISGSRLTVSALKRGLTEFSVSGSDSRGLSAGFAFQVYVMDPSNPVELSSTVVRDKLVIRTGELRETRVRISGQTGKVVYDGILQIGAFHPVTIDMGAFAPGAYKVAVTMGGETYEYRIVKI